MMKTSESFRDRDWLAVYDSAETDIINDLINPLLSMSVSYLRGVAFFTSSWLRLAAAGLTSLVNNDGRARIIMSPALTEDDWEAIHFGNQARCDEALQSVLRRNLDALRAELEEDTLNAFAWLIADEYLDIKFAVPRLRTATGDYHDKAAVFRDTAGNCVAIHGSFNDSLKATRNGEAFSVFCSWKDGIMEYVRSHEARLEELWSKGNSQFRSIDIPLEFKNEIVSLRNSPRPPYSPQKLRKPFIVKRRNVCLPAIPRKYQLDAVQEWERAGCRGFFEMATGTGKTITALTAAASQWERRGKLALVIAVPYLHLIDQWARIVEECHWRPILASGQHRDWHISLKSIVQDFRNDSRDRISVIITHDSAADGKLRRVLADISSEHLMYIADEAHGLGAAGKRNALLENAGLRLGLSATPERWFDPNGTRMLFDYFGKTCYSLPLKSAIAENHLVPYEYHPVIVRFTDDEGEAFSELTSKIGRLVGMRDQGRDVAEQLRSALLERSRIINGCARKIPALDRLLGNLIENSPGLVRDLLVYCADGAHQEPLACVSGRGLAAHQFTCRENPTERRLLIDNFSTGKLQALVSMRCLDEGVDIPSARTAVFLASATNPRQFIQRRGRVLRKALDKSHAVIYDFIVFPSEGMELLDGARALLGREMPRFAEYADCCRNQFEARSVVRDELSRLGLLHLLDVRPWEARSELSDEIPFTMTDE